MGGVFLSVEIGGTKQQIALATGAGRLLHRISEKIRLDHGAADILNWLAVRIPALITQGKRGGLNVAAIGVGFGGPLETAHGRVLCSVQVDGWDSFALKQWFEDTFGMPTWVLNDTVAAGYGEYKYGSGRGSRSFFYSNIGSGIGGMMIIGGTYYDGIGYSAGYIGHTYIPDWTVPEPGVHQKLENICSGWAIEKRLRTPGYVPAGSALTAMCGGDVRLLTCRILGEAARQGDAFAKDEIDRVAWSYSIGLSNVITLFSPDRVSIGGGVANMGDVLLDPMRTYTDKLVFVASRGRYKIEQCALMDDNVLIGAAVYAAEQMAK